MLTVTRPQFPQAHTALCSHCGGGGGGGRPGPAGQRRPYLVDGGVFPQRQVPETASHLVPALSHCKGERHGSGTGRGQREVGAPRPPYPAPPPTGSWQRRRRSPVSKPAPGSRAPRVPAVERPNRCLSSAGAPACPPRAERAIGERGGEGGDSPGQE